MGAIPAVLSLLLIAMATPVFATNLNDRLWSAASEGDLEGVKAALEDGADANYATQEKDGRIGVLHVAAQAGHADIVALLLSRGANVNIVDKLGDTPLATALGEAVFSLKRNVEYSVAELLIASGANVRHADKSGMTPLHLAAKSGGQRVAQLLLDRGADVNAVDQNAETPLDVARDAPTADFLLGHGGRTAGIANNGKTRLAEVDRQLFMAAIAGDAQGIRSAVSRGAHVNIRDGSHDTPLMSAVYLGRIEAASALLDEGADVEEAGPGGLRPLHVAAGNGGPGLVKLLLRYGPDINAENASSETPIEEVGDAETARILLRAGASANAPNLLCNAATTGGRELVEALLSYGADANSRCLGGTPLLPAISSKKWDIVPILLDHGADPNVADSSGFTPLLLASGSGSAQTVALLLGHGARIDTASKDGDTPLIEAAQYGRKDVVKLLLDRGATSRPMDVAALRQLSLPKTSKLLIYWSHMVLRSRISSPLGSATTRTLTGIKSRSLKHWQNRMGRTP
jgi:ankyrin